MRWPHFGRQSRHSDATANGSGAHDAPVPSSAAHSAAQAWSALPPIPSSWGTSAPLTAPPQLPAPRPRTSLPRRSSLVPPDVAPEPGRVIGLASVVVPTPVPAAPVTPPAYFAEQPPLRHATARPLVEHAPLTAATDDYVGEPVAPSTPATAAPAPAPQPASPFPTPTPIRPDPAVEATTEAGARFREALANLHKSGLPRYDPPTGSDTGSAATPAPAATAPTTEPEPTGGPAAPPRLTHRRTLAESRRLGLGAPIRPEAEEPGTADPQEQVEAAAAPPATPPLPAPPSPTPPALPPAASSARDDARPGPAPALREPLHTTPVVRPLADATVSPGRRAAALVFRSAPRDPDRAVQTAPPRRAVVTRPPAELAAALRASHGIDVADVDVQRDGAAGSEASRRSARAFTRAGTVFLPEAAGPVSSPTTRGLLAHELVHAAQQRRLGASLPAESSPEGRALEAEAQAAERAYGGAADTPLRHAAPAVTPTWVEERLTQHALDLPMPANYPRYLMQPDQGMLDEVKYTAQEVVRQAIDEGAAGGAGGLGALGGTRNVPKPEDFAAQLLIAVNTEREAQNLRPISRLDELQGPDRALVEAQMGNVRQLRAQMDIQESFRKQLEQSQPNEAPAGSAAVPAGTVWTPQGGFWRTGTGGAAGTAGLPPGTPAALAAGPAGAAAAAAGPAGGPAAPLPGSPAAGSEPPGLGVGHFHTREEFEAQVVDAVNAQLGPGAPRLTSIAQLGAADRAVIEEQWSVLETQLHDQKLRSAFQRALPPPAAAVQQSVAAGPAAHPAAAAHAGSAGAAPAADTHASGAAHTEYGNVTAMGRHEVSLDAVDLTDLSVRIYDRLRSRLRTELLVDRERAGLLTDFR